MEKKMVKFQGIVQRIRQGVGAKTNKPWVSVTVKVPGVSRIETDDGEVWAYHSCYCGDSVAIDACHLSEGDFVEVRGSERFEIYLKRDGSRGYSNYSVTVDDIKLVQTAPKSRPAAQPAPEEPPVPDAAPPEDDDHLPF